MKPKKLPKDWQEVELGNKEYFEILSSGIEKFEGEKDYLSTESIQGTNIKKIEAKITCNNRPSRANMQPVLNSIWFAKMQATLKVYCFDKDNKEEINKFVLSTGFAGIKVNEKKVYPKYLKYFFLSSYFNKIKDVQCHGATQKAIRNEEIKNLKIPLPPIQTQQKIVSILEKAEKLKEKRRKANEEMQKYLHAVFYGMFGDPVRNEKKWEIKKLVELCKKITDGKHGDCRNSKSSGYYFISAKDIADWKIDYSQARQIVKEDFLEVHKRTNLELHDVLISNSGTIGKIAIANDKNKVKRTTFQKSVAIIKNKKNKVNSYFLGYLLYFTKNNLINQSSGSSQKNLLLRDIKNFRVIVPPLPLQQKFAKIVEKVEKLREKQEKSEQEINELFESLMQRAFRGELIR